MTDPTKDLTPHTDPSLIPNGPAPFSPRPSIFFGPDGLRAGWSLLIFSLLFALLATLAFSIGHKIQSHSPHTAKTISTRDIPQDLFLISESTLLIVTLVATWIMSRIEQHPFTTYGLGGNRRVSHFFAGLVWGALCLSLLVFILWKTGLLVVDGRLLFGSNILRHGAIWFIGFLLVSLFEETLFRGYLLYTLSRGFAGIYKSVFKARHSATLGFWTCAVLFSLFFGLSHRTNSGESPIGLFAAGLVSLVFCLSLWRTGSLWWAIGFHASWDWAQSFLYGVADSGTIVQHHLLATRPVGSPLLSGGTTGPEGSVFILSVLALIGLIICFTLPQKNDAALPNESATNKADLRA